MFLNDLEYKYRKTKNPVYTSIANMYGKTATYTETNYYSIAKEGYKENHVFFRCMQEIINAAIQGEWIVKRKLKDGTEENIDNHPILKLLNKPSEIHSKQEFIRRVISYYYIGGEAPLHKIIASGEVRNILTYRPDKIEFESTGDLSNPYKNIKYGPSGTSIEPKNFTLFKNFNPLDDLDGLGHGMSMMEPSLKNGDLLNAFIDWNVSLLQNGASPAGAWIYKDVIDDDETFKRAEKKIRNKYSGTRNAGKDLFLDGDMGYIKLGENPKDMDWKDGKESTIIDICCAFGVDPILIGYNKFSSYNNKKEAKKDLYTSTVIPLMGELCGCLTRFLLGKEENIYISMDYSHVPVMQEDESERFKRITENKILTINEKRQELGYDEIEGGNIIGDIVLIDGEPYIPMNLVPVGFEKEEE